MKIKLPRPRKPKYFEIVITWTILTVGGLFAGQYWFYSYSTATVYGSEMPANGQEMAALQAAQHEKMANATLSIEEAMQRLAQADRNSIPLIAPEVSADMGPAAGWMHHPDYEAPPAYDPSTAPVVLPEDGAEGLEQEEASTEETDAIEATDGEPAAPEPADDAAPATMRPATMVSPDGPTGMIAAPAVMAAMAPAAMAPAAMTANMDNAPAAAADTE